MRKGGGLPGPKAGTYPLPKTKNSSELVHIHVRKKKNVEPATVHETTHLKLPVYLEHLMDQPLFRSLGKIVLFLSKDLPSVIIKWRAMTFS